jgi:hypothetical protein
MHFQGWNPSQMYLAYFLDWWMNLGATPGVTFYRGGGIDGKAHCRADYFQAYFCLQLRRVLSFGRGICPKRCICKSLCPHSQQARNMNSHWSGKRHSNCNFSPGIMPRQGSTFSPPFYPPLASAPPPLISLICGHSLPIFCVYSHCQVAASCCNSALLSHTLL